MLGDMVQEDEFDTRQALKRVVIHVNTLRKRASCHQVY